MKKNKGFTLIELLVVIAIIAILTTIVLASLDKARSKSRDTKRISDISQLQLALSLYLNKYSHYPIVTGEQNLTELTTLKFISVLPVDPLNDTTHKYGYKTDGTGSTYCLSAALENTSSYIDPSNTNGTGCTTDITDPAAPATSGIYVYKVTK